MQDISPTADTYDEYAATTSKRQFNTVLTLTQTFEFDFDISSVAGQKAITETWLDWCEPDDEAHEAILALDTTDMTSVEIKQAAAQIRKDIYTNNGRSVEDMLRDLLWVFSAGDLTSHIRQLDENYSAQIVHATPRHPVYDNH